MNRKPRAVNHMRAIVVMTKCTVPSTDCDYRLETRERERQYSESQRDACWALAGAVATPLCPLTTHHSRLARA